MTSVAKNLLEQALVLSEDDREQLASLLLVSVGNDSAAEIDAAWRTEVSRRMADLDSGAVRPIPWEQAEEMIFGDQDAVAGKARLSS